jgi:hypothetical protein
MTINALNLKINIDARLIFFLNTMNVNFSKYPVLVIESYLLENTIN